MEAEFANVLSRSDQRWLRSLKISADDIPLQMNPNEWSALCSQLRTDIQESERELMQWKQLHGDLTKAYERLDAECNQTARMLIETQAKLERWRDWTMALAVIVAILGVWVWILLR